MTTNMNTIDHAQLATIHGGFGNPVDLNVAQSCMTATSENWAPIGGAAGAAASLVATRGVGMPQAIATGQAVGRGLGAGFGWLGSVVSQFLGGNPCPTAPSSVPTTPAR
jgi:hypothetical protein